MRLVALALLVGVLAGAPPAVAEDVTFSVAISMKEAIEELGGVFTRAHPDVKLHYNFGSSGALQKQIEAGAPVDLFVSAAARQMDELERQGLVIASTRRAFARNVLVVVTPVDSTTDLSKPADLVSPRVRRIAIGSRTVPAGQYAEESLKTVGVWERVQPKLVLADNVRQVLDYVARGEADAGFVYATDAALRPAGVKEAFRPAEDTYGPIVYPVAVVAASRHAAVARAFIDVLTGEGGRTVLARLGFRPAPAGTR